MPRVPYNPVPEVAPANAPAPFINVSTPPAAFGVGIADSIERLGGTAEKVGNELFERAYAMQQLRNETEATEAGARYEKEAGMLHANYSNLQGLNAVNAFPKYQADLDAKRMEIRNGMSNDFARKMYDRSSLSLMGRSIFNGAGHAGQQNKVAADGAAQAEINSITDSALQNPDDEASFNANLTRLDAAVRKRADLYGKDDTALAHDLAEAKSRVISARIQGINRTDPQRAKQMREDAKDILQAKDIDHLDPRIQQQIRIVGSRNISDSVNAGWAPYMTAKQIAITNGVQQPLLDIVQEAQRAHPELRFGPTDDLAGFRTAEQQAQIFARGHTTTLRSNHMVGRAIDIVPLDDKTSHEDVERAMKEASAKLGIPLSGEHDRIKSWDPVHYSIPNDYNVADAPKRGPEPEESRINRAFEYAKQQIPDDPLYADIVRDRTRADFAHLRQVQLDTFRNNIEVLNKGIQDRGDGQPPRNIDELLANPQARAAYEALPADKQNAIPRAINAYNNSVAQKTDEATLTQLRGMAETDRDQFMHVDPLDPNLPLSQSARRQVIALQARKRKDPESSPRLNRALQVLSPMINDPDRGIDKKENPEKYYEFVGALDDALDYEVQRTGKQPSFDEIKEIGNRMWYGWQVGGWFKSGQEPLFSYANKMSSAERDAVRLEIMKKNPGAEVTDRDIMREVARQLYIKNFGAASKPKAEPK